MTETRYLTASEQAGAGRPRKRPTLAEVRKWPATVDVEMAATAIGCSRSTAYEAITAGTFPAKVITVSRRKVVITASLVALLEGGGDALAS